MNSDVSEIFRNCRDLDSFRSAIISLNGKFPFNVNDMIRLGEVYFQKYPEGTETRDQASVLLGYRIIRVCILEKILTDLHDPYKNLFRSIFFSISDINSRINELSKTGNSENLLEFYQILSSGINDIKNDIDSIPIGMIKERFIGAISSFYNALYIMKETIDKYTA